MLLPDRPDAFSKKTRPRLRSDKEGVEYARTLLALAEKEGFRDALEAEARKARRDAEQPHADTFALARQVAKARRERADDSGTPVLDTVTPGVVSPGSQLVLTGSNLGTHVWIAIDNENNAYECQVISKVIHGTGGPGGSTSEIVGLTVKFPKGAGGYRPYNGAVWVESDDGQSTSSLPMRVEPALQYYGMFISTTLTSTFGIPGVKNGTLGEGALPDPDQQLFAIYREHSGGGWSKQTEPFANRGDLRQGYHIGNGNAFVDTSIMTLWFYVSFPWAVQGGKPANMPASSDDSTTVSGWGDATRQVPQGTP